MVVTASTIFQEGIYTIDQAAHLARLSSRCLRRWLDGAGESQPTLQRRVPKNDAEVIGFLDLIQALAIRNIRQHDKLSLQQVRQTIVEAEKLGVRYPFAREHKTFVFHDDVVIAVGDQLFQVTGKYRQQQLIEPIVELYLEDLTFDPVTKLAKDYSPSLFRDASGAKVVINPTMKYGAPVVMPGGHTVSALIHAVESEGSIGAAAEMFDVPEANVKLALRYEDFLLGTAA